MFSLPQPPLSQPTSSTAQNTNQNTNQNPNTANLNINVPNAQQLQPQPIPGLGLGQSTPNAFTDTFAGAGFTQSFGGSNGGVQDMSGMSLGLGGAGAGSVGVGFGNSGFGSSGYGLGLGVGGVGGIGQQQTMNFNSSFNPNFNPNLNLNLNLNPNSPEGFRANLQLALSYVGEIVRLVQIGRNGIEKAYNADSRPVDLIACLSNLNSTLDALWTLLRHSGIGALPITPPPSLTHPGPSLTIPPATDSTSTATPGESVPQATVTNASDAINASEKATQQLYERLKRVQGNHGVVANILGADVRR